MRQAMKGAANSFHLPFKSTYSLLGKSGERFRMEKQISSRNRQTRRIVPVGKNPEDNCTAKAFKNPS
jgi:hypothetical protein